jgi:hypothetical protein
MTNTEHFTFVPVQNSRGEIALRPQLSLALSFRNNSVNTTGLLDSGADVSVLPYRLGEALGADWNEQNTHLEFILDISNWGDKPYLRVDMFRYL